MQNYQLDRSPEDSAMETRRKSCEACHKAKRRCDLRPVCGRCKLRSLTCNYTNQPPVSERPESVVPVLKTIQNSPQDVTTMPSANLGLQLEIFDPSLIDIDDWISNPVLEPKIAPCLPDLNSTVQPKHTDFATWRYLAHELARYPEMFVRLGYLPFTDGWLYKDRTPKAIRIIFRTCAGYISKSPRNENLIYEAMDDAAWELGQLPSGTIEEHLALVQSLTLLQIMRLFDGDVRQRILGEEGEKSFENRTRQLCIRQQEEVAVTNSDRLLHEAIRRTVIMSYMLRGVYSMLKHGYCDVLTVLAQLKISVSAVSGYVASTDINWDSHVQPGNELLTYGDFTDRWEMGLITQVAPLERLLLVACEGKQVIDEALPTPV